ncbi:hypothetical protein SBADM41S_00037 [Streptomyces badius]
MATGQVGDPFHLILRGALAALVEDEQDRRAHPLVPLPRGCGPAGAPHSASPCRRCPSPAGGRTACTCRTSGAIRTASSVQLSASMNSSGTPASGAVRTTSARALPIAGFFQVPFTGSATSVAYEGEGADPVPGGVDGGLRGGDRFGRAARRAGRGRASGGSARLTVSFTVIGWEAPEQAGALGHAAHLLRLTVQVDRGGGQPGRGEDADLLVAACAAAVDEQAVPPQIVRGPAMGGGPRFFPRGRWGAERTRRGGWRGRARGRGAERSGGPGTLGRVRARSARSRGAPADRARPAGVRSEADHPCTRPPVNPPPLPHPGMERAVRPGVPQAARPRAPSCFAARQDRQPPGQSSSSVE